MTVEELMKPRYKVIADYPKCPFGDVGRVIELKNGKYEWAEYDGMYSENESFFQEYPHLFKPLKWWEDRKPEDMPEYVKLKPEYGGRVYKLSEAKESYGGKAFMFDYPITEHWIDLSQCIPATETEYTQYINKNKVK